MDAIERYITDRSLSPAMRNVLAAIAQKPVEGIDYWHAHKSYHNSTLWALRRRNFIRFQDMNRIYVTKLGLTALELRR